MEVNGDASSQSQNNTTPDPSDNNNLTITQSGSGSSSGGPSSDVSRPIGVSPVVERSPCLSLGFDQPFEIHPRTPSRHNKGGNSGSSSVSGGTGGWGVWPGAAYLPRVVPPVSGKRLPPPPSSSSRGKRGGSGVGETTHQRKDRLLFLGKPPQLLSYTSTMPSSPQEKSSWVASHTVVLSHLQWWLNDCDVREAAGTYGDVRAVRLLTDPSNGASLGLGLVEFTSSENAAKSVKDGGAAWRSKQETSSRPPGIHPLPEETLNKIVNDEYFHNLEPHWVWGTPFTIDAILSLFQVAQIAPPTTILRLRKVDDHSNDSNAADFEKKINSFRLKFPFAAAAAIAASLLETTASPGGRDPKRMRLESDSSTLGASTGAGGIAQLQQQSSNYQPWLHPRRAAAPFRPSSGVSSMSNYHPGPAFDLYPTNRQLQAPLSAAAAAAAAYAGPLPRYDQVTVGRPPGLLQQRNNNGGGRYQQPHQVALMRIL